MNTDVASQPQEYLLEAFSAADYRVRVAGTKFVVRPGRRHEALDEALEHREWAIVTAFNPRASQIGASENRARHRRLLQAVAGYGHQAHPAVNADPSGAWPDEAALLIVDAPFDEVDTIAARFEQAAVVTGRPGGPALLRLYGNRWPQELPRWARRAG